MMDAPMVSVPEFTDEVRALIGKLSVDALIKDIEIRNLRQRIAELTKEEG